MIDAWNFLEVEGEGSGSRVRMSKTESRFLAEPHCKAGGGRRMKDRRGWWRGWWEAHKLTDARACTNAVARARAGVYSYGVCGRESKRRQV